MENNRENEAFSYTYSAKQRSEVEHIREKYMPKEEDKMDQLRRLDSSVAKKGSVAALAVGILGALTMGVGMSCAMVWHGFWFVPGIIIGIVGMAIAALAYPLYQRVTAKEREKIAPEIMRLTDELMK